MVLRVLGDSARVAILIVAVLLAVAISYDSIRNARAAHAAALQTAAGFERAARLEPGSARYWYLLGRYWQYNLEQPDTLRAVSAYEKALSMSPGDADAWLDLAAAFESEGQVEPARKAYGRAQHAYPASAEVAWRYGNFLLRQGENSQAFEEIRAAVSADPGRGAEAFSRCFHADPDVEDVLNRALPPLPAVYVDIIRDLSFAHQPDAASRVWSRLVALDQRFALRDIGPYFDVLLSSGRFQQAKSEWAQAVELSGVLAVPDPAGSVVWDASFESRESGGGFTWFFPADKNGVEAVLDDSDPRSGAVSLRLSFDGKSNVFYRDACQRLVVQPSATYDFSAWVRAKSLTTDQGIRFFLFLPGMPALKTSDIHGTTPWTNLHAVWTIPSSVEQATLCAGREPSDQNDDKIQGIAWVDDVTMIPRPAGSALP